MAVAQEIINFTSMNVAEKKIVIKNILKAFGYKDRIEIISDWTSANHELKTKAKYVLIVFWCLKFENFSEKLIGKKTVEVFKIIWTKITTFFKRRVSIMLWSFSS